MKQISIIVLLSAMTFAGFSQVQRKSTPSVKQDSTGAPMADNTADKTKKKEMLRELNLTKEQRGKLKEMRQANKAKKEAIENDQTLTEEQRQAKLKDMRKEGAAGLQQVLTDEQKAKMKTMRQEKMANKPPAAPNTKKAEKRAEVIDEKM